MELIISFQTVKLQCFMELNGRSADDKTAKVRWVHWRHGRLSILRGRSVYANGQPQLTKGKVHPHPSQIAW